MNELLQSLHVGDLPNWVLLIISAIVGTAFAYFRKWAWAKEDYPMLGTRRDRAKAITKLVGSLAVSLTVDMQTGMNTTAVIVLGVGIGLAVPVEVAKEEMEQKESNQMEKAEAKA
jgi:hypothetical protein